VQDLPLDEIERIEIVAGPGGALWGANAVNGVINIVSRPASASQGGVVELGAGDGQQRFGHLRVGGTLGARGAGRAYVKHVQQDAFGDVPSTVPRDWRLSQLGGRADWTTAGGVAATLQGDAYAGRDRGPYRAAFVPGQPPAAPVPASTDVHGANLLARWSRERADDGWQLQAYVDHTRRDIPNTYRDRRTTADVDFQHRRALGARHELTWGAGATVVHDDFGNTSFATFEPVSRTVTTFNAFAQDRWQLGRDTVLTAGVRLEHNDYTGLEVQPNLRLWTPLGERQVVWLAASRAVRTPSRLESSLRLVTPLTIPGLALPAIVEVRGSPALDAERLTAFEAGYRLRASERVSLDLATYWNVYRWLQTQEAQTPDVVALGGASYLRIPLLLGNGLQGETRGGTLALTLRPRDDWRVQIDYTYIDYELELRTGSRNTGALNAARRSPRFEAAVHSYLDLPAGWSLYLGARRVDALAALAVPAYTAIDASVQWRSRGGLELALTGRNLADDAHVEFGTAPGNRIERSAYATVRTRF
jgi:iron complex outermembrane receptor protein